MIKKEITIGGKQYPVIFTMRTISNFEERTGKTLIGDSAANLELVSNKVALIHAAVRAADENTSISEKDIRGDESLQAYTDITTAYLVILTIAIDFFKVPDGDKESPSDSGEAGKNS